MTDTWTTTLQVVFAPTHDDRECYAVVYPSEQDALAHAADYRAWAGADKPHGAMRVLVERTTEGNVFYTQGYSARFSQYTMYDSYDAYLKATALNGLSARQKQLLGITE